MAKIKIDQFNDYYNAELTGVFHEDVAILGGGDTEEEAIAEMKANAEVWLGYVIKDAKVEKYWNGEPVEVQNRGQKAEEKRKMNIIHCENCRFWQDGYCTLRKKETCDGATCDKAEEY